MQRILRMNQFSRSRFKTRASILYITNCLFNYGNVLLCFLIEKGILAMNEDMLQLKRLTLAQRMNRLKEQEARIKNIERKTRTKRLIEIGWLVAKANLDSLTSNELYGALLEISDKAKDTTKIKVWEEKGGKTFFRETKQNGEPIIVKFTEKPDNETRKILREHGLKWNSLRQEWEGIADYLAIKSMVENINGSIRKLVPTDEIT